MPWRFPPLALACITILQLSTHLSRNSPKTLFFDNCIRRPIPRKSIRAHFKKGAMVARCVDPAPRPSDACSHLCSYPCSYPLSLCRRYLHASFRGSRIARRRRALTRPETTPSPADTARLTRRGAARVRGGGGRGRTRGFLPRRRGRSQRAIRL